MANGPNRYDRSQTDVLTEGLVLTIEPMISAGSPEPLQDPDGWTIRTRDGSLVRALRAYAGDHAWRTGDSDRCVIDVRRRARPWAAGAAYEPFVGRWSRPIARAFLEWLAIRPRSAWLDIGCGTGAVSDAILTHQRSRACRRVRSVRRIHRVCPAARSRPTGGVWHGRRAIAASYGRDGRCRGQRADAQLRPAARRRDHRDGPRRPARRMVVGLCLGLSRTGCS